MELLFNPIVYRATLRQLATTAYKQLTGKTRDPGVRELRNTWLSSLEYSAKNMIQQENRLENTYALPSAISLLRKQYAEERRLGNAIQMYLEDYYSDRPEYWIEPERRFLLNLNIEKVAGDAKGRDGGKAPDAHRDK